MNKRVLAGLLAAMLLLGGCSGTEAESSSVPVSEPAQESQPVSESQSESELVSESESEPSSKMENVETGSETESSAETESQNETPQIYGAEEAAEHSLEGGPSWIYNDVYNSIDGKLIHYIGSDRFDDWVKNTDTPHNMQTCIETFDLTADEIREALTEDGNTLERFGFTDETINILCSGDQAAINRTFASEYAAVSNSGSIYTIFWLAEHTAADYQAEGIPKSEIESVISNLEELGGMEDYLTPLREQAALMPG